MGLGAEVRLRGDGVHIPELYSQFQGELGNPQTLGVSVIGCLVVLTGPGCMKAGMGALKLLVLF